MTSPRIPAPTQLPASETTTSTAVTPTTTPTFTPTFTPTATPSDSKLPTPAAAAEDSAPTSDSCPAAPGAEPSASPAVSFTAEAAAETAAEAAGGVTQPPAAPSPQTARPAEAPPLLPTQACERYMILDTLRGFAILGIALANYPELSLYRFLPADAAAALPASGWDRAINFIVHSLVDGKFYTIFSLLFGIGFSIILQNITRRGGRVLPLFMRRMLLLALMGLAHLLFIWSGDILLLYALMGMMLASFRNLADRTLFICALAFLLLPIGIDAACEYADLHPAAFFVQLQQQACAHSGITAENFATWLRDADSYSGMFDFLIQGAAVRAQEFIDGNRYFKVLGLFLLGFLIGRHRLYARLAEHRRALRRITLIGGGLGLMLAPLFAWSSINGHPWGIAAHSLIYTLSVYPLAFAYMSFICLAYLRCSTFAPFRWLAAPGRMALSNYLMQSLIGVLLYYGIGLGLGASLPLAGVEFVALLIFIVQMILSSLWLRAFRYGPLEWIWRILTYGRYFPCRR